MPLPTNNVPHYTLTLPTSSKKIKYRPYLVGEQKIALMAAESGVENIMQTLRQIVDQCTFEKLDVDIMPDFEVEWLFLNIRMRSSGENVDMVVTCSHCKEQHDYALNLKDVKLVIGEGHTTKIMISDEMGVEMTYPTAEQLDDLKKNYSTSAVYQLIKDCMKNVFTLDEVFPCKDESPEELDQWMNSLTDAQFANIENFFATMPTVRHEFTETCPHCNEQSKYVMEGVESFFG